MTSRTWLTLARVVAAGAGLMDTLTGLGLILVPVLTLRAMGVEAPGPGALVYVRFVGSFVTAVGASYLLALSRGGARDLRVMFASTLVFRLAAGLFTAAAAATGALTAAWLIVTATDLALVGFQSWMLRGNQPKHE